MECCYICSPYRGNVFERIRNRRYARYLTAKAIKMGYAPIAPHLYITQVLNDKIPEERKHAKRVNKCNFFDLNTIDAFGENEKGYIPRKPKQKEYNEQLRLFGEEAGSD